MKLIRALATALLSLCSPVLMAFAAIALAITDLEFLLFERRTHSGTVNVAPLSNECASVVIPNWNGRDLLEKFLPSVVAALQGNPANEILVVDNASTDGSVEFLRREFPEIRVLPLDRNIGFGGGSNAGFAEARNDIVVLLNNDMRVEPGFIAPLLRPFADPAVFSVSCQIFFSDAAKQREETGLTESWWEAGRLRVSHRNDPAVDQAFPCAYPGGGSSAFDRKKFLELGGFDPLYHPFYYEDTDLGVLAWKRGWKVLYEPTSVVYHEHRGTIGRRFSREYIDGIIKKNLLLYTWKNIHDWRWLGSHFFEWTGASLFSIVARSHQARATPVGTARAFIQLPSALKARRKARSLARIKDREAFRRQKGGFFRDRFQIKLAPVPERLHVLFVSPYPIEPPTHGGAVFMKQTLEALQLHADVHLLSFVDNSMQLPEQAVLGRICSSVHFLVRKHFVPLDPLNPAPRVVREFWDREFDWTLHREVFLLRIDLLQIEYTFMAQYGEHFNRIPTFLFEHDISFQSMGRRIQKGLVRPGLLLAYLQLLRYELSAVSRFTRVQVCSKPNEEYLLSYAPELHGRIDAGLRAIVDCRKYPFVDKAREVNTLLFAGSFNHLPNVEGLRWFVDQVWRRVRQANPSARLVIVGSGNMNRLGKILGQPSIEWRGFVPDVREPLQRYAALVCPVLSGSGVRVKLLEAFASGIPVVSTRLGAEGLAERPGQYCELADDPNGFANAVLRVLANRSVSDAMAVRARLYVEQERDAQACTAALTATYRREVQKSRMASTESQNRRSRT